MASDRENVRNAIISLHQQNKRQVEIVRLLNIEKSVVSKTIKRFKELGHIKDRPQSGRPQTANTPINRKIIRECIRCNFQRSMRKMGREIGI